jgi:DNA-binding MarR family transcriptional regulator
VNDTRTILDAIRRLVRFLRLASREAEREQGVSAAQLFVLQTLKEHPKSCINELAARTLTDQSSVSVVISKLVERGLVSRTPSAQDGRRVELTLTPAGLTRGRQVKDTVQRRLIAALEDMREGDRRQLAHLLTDLLEKAGLADSPAPLLFEDRDGERGGASRDY